MQTNTSKNRKISQSRKLKVNAVTMGQQEWYILHPEIKLSGPWLERLGFEPGNTIRVTAIGNELLITPIGRRLNN